MKKILLTGVSLAVLLSGCTPVGVAVGAGSAVGVAMVQERGVRSAISDNTVQLQIGEKWFKKNWTMFQNLSTTVTEGRVLITGTVPNPDMRVEAVRLAWQVDGVKQVLNEINVSEGGGVVGAVTDTWITSNLKTRLMFDKTVESVNYNVDTVNGNVYLMGIAQNQKELTRVIEHARSIGRVSNVVSYVRLKYENPDAVADTTN